MTQREHIGMFTTVDALEDPGVFIRLMDRVQDAPDVRAARADLLDRLQLEPGQTVLDLGCGTGDHTRELAARLPPGGRATGVDFSTSMVSEATRRQAASDAPASFEQGDAQQLRFETGTFDACRTERMLCHVPDCQVALREMVRVVRPGGRVGIIDFDAAGTIIDHSDRATTNAFVGTLTAVVRHPWMGRMLRRLMGEVGLVDIDVRPMILEIGYGIVEPMIAMHAELMRQDGVAPETIEAWQRELELANLKGTFYMGMTMFSAVGRKPQR
jgi:ubiquinone/menaquinone biosynthesis C-methylase UbiE